MKPYPAPIARRIFNALCAAPYGLTSRELCLAVYTDADGGPEWAASSVRKSIYHFNRRAAAEGRGFRIRGSTTGVDSRFQIWIVRVDRVSRLSAVRQKQTLPPRGPSAYF